MDSPKHTGPAARRISMLRRALATLAAASVIPPAAHAARRPPRVRRATLDEVRQWLAGRHKAVLTFLGYSGAEYEFPARMLAEAAAVLAGQDPSRVIVNIGATADGIGAVYALARQRGFETMGIVSSQAPESGARWAPAVDHIFVIEDPTWGGADAAGNLHPTSRAMVTVSDELVAIGGGDIARVELQAGREAGKRSRFIPAEFNHGVAQRKASQAGKPPPTRYASAIGETAWQFP